MSIINKIPLTYKEYVKHKRTKKHNYENKNPFNMQWKKGYKIKTSSKNA